MLAHHSRLRAQTVRNELDARARELGYSDLGQMLTNTPHMTHAAVGDLLGCSAAKARSWRNIYGIRSTARSTAARADAANRRVVLANILPGTQPISDDGTLQCLVCGRWWRDLRQHVQRTHHQTVDNYLKHYGLEETQAVVSRELQAKRIAAGQIAGASNLKAAASAKSDRVKAAYDRRATQRGYSGIEALLAVNTDRHTIAELIGCAPSSVGRIRRRYTT
jgi:predicted transcriptional regulator